MNQGNYQHLCNEAYAAEYLGGLCPQTLQNWRYKGIGPKFIKVGGAIRYRIKDLEKYLDDNTRQSTSKG